MQVVFPRKATYQKSITKTSRKCDSKFRKISLFILAVGSLGGRTHFQRFMEIEVLKKIQMFCMWISDIVNHPLCMQKYMAP